MNIKKLQQKLAKKTQEIIENVPCQKCGKNIHYVLTNRGSAVDVYYREVETEQQTIIQQNGEFHSGFGEHICKKGGNSSHD